MSDTLSRIKLQLRPVNGSVLNGNGNGNGNVNVNGNGDDKTPTTPTTKLLINHGKPNYTIQRSTRGQQNGIGTESSSNEIQNNNRNNYYPYKSAGVQGTAGIVTNGLNNNKAKVTINYNNNNNNSSNSSPIDDDLIIKSTKLNGVFKPANIQQSESKDELDNPVVLRRVQKLEKIENITTNVKDENVPEFILRQRRIQERLAKENVLDFENRRSGYFTHVVISPTSPNRASLVETMVSPPVEPSLEMPPPTPIITQSAKEATIAEESCVEVSEAVSSNGVELENKLSVTREELTKEQVEEEAEVAQAIEEVNKAVAGEIDDEKIHANDEDVKEVTNEKVAKESEDELKKEPKEVVEQKVEDQHVEVKVVEYEKTPVEQSQTSSVPVLVANGANTFDQLDQVTEKCQSTVETSIDLHCDTTNTNEVQVIHAAASELNVETTTKPVQPKESELKAADKENENVTSEDVTILHVNGIANGISNEISMKPALPKPDPSGALGVNYEPKTVVSFSKDLDAPNKYPDTVMVVKTNEETVCEGGNEELKELTKLKFDIKADDEDVQVTPVLRTD